MKEQAAINQSMMANTNLTTRTTADTSTSSSTTTSKVNVYGSKKDLPKALAVCACAVTVAAVRSWWKSSTKSTALHDKRLPPTWNVTFDMELALGERCNIDRVDERDMTKARFEQDYWKRKPVVLVRHSQPNTAAQELTKKHALLSNFGNVDIPLAKLESYAFRDEKMGSLSEYISSMDDVVSNSSRFAFSTDQYGVGEVYVVPDLMPPNLLDPSFQLAIAASGTGLAFHWHADVWAETLHGARRWMLYPPQTSPQFNPRATSAQWLKEVRSTWTSNEEALQECTILPNEAIYVPADWFHSTLSLGEAVSITTSYASTFRRDRYMLTNGPSDNAHMLDAFEKGDFETAGRFAEQWRLYRPQNFAPYSWLGVILTFDAKKRHAGGTLEEFQTAIYAARDATARCIELNPLFCPCHVWLSRQLMALSATYKGIDPTKEQRFMAKAKEHVDMAGKLSSVDDDELLDPRWQPKSMNRARHRRQQTS